MTNELTQDLLRYNESKEQQRKQTQRKQRNQFIQKKTKNTLLHLT
jgi:hypothetical protein